ncbi:hypothetical protein ACQ4PT_024759 [Festuca glaucescens]
MGQLDLIHREHRFRQIQICDGSTSSLAIRKESPCLRYEDFHGGKRRGYSGTKLPEDIWCHIHSLMTLRDAPCADCVSRAFLCSWRCYPNIIFNTKIMGMSRDRGFTQRVDDILKKHWGIGVKTFELDFSHCCKPKVNEYLHGWLPIVVTPGIEKLTLVMPEDEAVNFPCPVLSDENGSSIRAPSFQLCCFGEVETHEMSRDNLHEDTFLAAAAQLPAGVKSATDCGC